jgi:AsmA protein
MQKTVKYLLIGVAVLLALLLAGAAILAATFNPNDYKPQIIRLVQEKTHRTLTIPGDIKLSFFPKIGANLGKLTISAPDSHAEFASVEHAKVSLALLPLLSKRVVVDRVTIDGLHASVTRFKDGSTSIDDLIKPAGNDKGDAASTAGKADNAGSGSKAGAESGGQMAFDIDSVDINNTQILFDDRMQGRTIELAKLDLETGRIADGVRSKLQLSSAIKASKPEINATLNVKTGFMMELARKHYVLDGLDARLKGSAAGFTDLVAKIAGDADLKPADKRFSLDGIKLNVSGKRAGQPLELALDVPQLVVDDTRVSGGKLSGSATLTESGRNVRVNLSAPAFEGSPQAFKLPNLALDATVKGGTLDAKAKLSGALAGDIDKLLLNSPQLTLALSGTQDGKALSGSLTTPMSADLHAQHIAFPKIAAGFTLPNPGGGTLQLKAGGNADLRLADHVLAAALKGSLDESAFDAKFGMGSFSPAAYTFDIGIDKLDLDRYRSKPAAAAQPEKSGAKSAANAGTKSVDNAAGDAAEKPIDLSALKNLQASGNVRIGALKVTGIRASSVRFGVHAAGGKLDIDPLSASLYGGSASGALSAAASKPARFTLRQTLSGINLGPLLKDAIGKQPIEGKGNVRLDVATSGASVVQIRKDLNGSANLELRDGAVHGVNIAQTVRSAKARIGALRGQDAAQSGTASADEKTDFSEMSGSFRITNGVAHNDDLNVKSPLVRVGGAGNIDLGAERIDYLAQVTVVSTLQGQGGPDLQALKGLTVPVRLSGPFSSIGWRIDFAGIANALAKQKLDEKKTELKSKAEEALGKQKGKLQEQLQDRLKGLFGK